MSPLSEGLLCLWVPTSQVLEASSFVPRDAQVVCQPMRDHSLSRGPAKSTGEPGLDPSFVCFQNAQTFPYCALSLLSSTLLGRRIM